MKEELKELLFGKKLLWEIVYALNWYVIRVGGCGLKSNHIHIISPTSSQLDEELSGQDSVYICYLLWLDSSVYS